MLFTYQARDATGRIRDGEISAANADEANRQLRTDGLYILALDPAVRTPENNVLAFLQKRITRNDIIYLTNQLAIMVDAGVPLANALEGLSKQSDNPRMVALLDKLQQDVEGGDDLSTALSRFPKQFDKTYVNLVKASEASGTLALMLDRISIQARNELDTRQQVQGAMMYPAGMLVMCVGVCIFLLTNVFPKITPLFISKGLDLPTPTKVMMFLSDALMHHWYWIIAGLILLTGGFLYARTKPWGRTAIDWVWLNIPILGGVIRKVTISRSLRTLATTINAGVPMLDALQLCGSVSNNSIYENTWKQAADLVAAGKQINEALDGSNLFPATLLQMISSGENTGKLGQVLNKVSDFYDRDVATSIKAATSMVEPVMVAVMGSVIGTIALAMLLPIFTLSGHTG